MIQSEACVTLPILAMPEALALCKQTRAPQVIWAPDAVRPQLNQPCLLPLTDHQLKLDSTNIVIYLRKYSL